MLQLQEPITVLKGIGKQRALDLQKLGIVTVGDLLGHYPYRYEDRSHLKPLRDMQEGDTETVLGNHCADAGFVSPPGAEAAAGESALRRRQRDAGVV